MFRSENCFGHENVFFIAGDTISFEMKSFSSVPVIFYLRNNTEVFHLRTNTCVSVRNISYCYLTFDIFRLKIPFQRNISRHFTCPRKPIGSIEIFQKYFKNILRTNTDIILKRIENTCT